MSQQINLFDPALLRKRELFTATNLAILVLVLALLVVAWGTMARRQMEVLDAESKVLAPQVKVQQDYLLQIGNQLAAAKPDPRLATELDLARDMLALRGEILAALKKGVGVEAKGYAEYLRGLARQTSGGLWLTAFSVGESGAALEIHGRMTDPASLPEYVRRLNAEPAFKGRAFARLEISAPQTATQDREKGATQKPAATSAQFLEFRLIPELVAGQAPAAANSAPGQRPALPLSELLPPDATRALEGKR